ncbi:MAG: peptidase [Cohaesibacteraceae bacterium]|nr:peptidase [Cohaesibacteraceae bacterium]
MKKMTAALAFIPALTISTAALAVTANEVVTNYADIAHASYQDSLNTAVQLKSAIDAFVASPSANTQTAAKAAWIAARAPYQQTEVYRFGNPIVDDFEGKVNAWPLDEGLIDYVDQSYGQESDANPLYVANVIANKSVSIGGDEIDATNITPALLSGSLHEAGEVEANVATGYHAIEFLLWGQDLNGNDKGAGNRSWTDYDLANCTNGNCARRADYLVSAIDLMITDLEAITAAWAKDGEARKDIISAGDTAGLQRILTGMGSLSYGELAGERMKLGLLLGDPEEEHDCFSDNTHNSHFYDVTGINNVWFGSYKRVDGSMIKGASLAQYLAEKDQVLSEEMAEKLKASLVAFGSLKTRAETIEAYDQMISEGNTEGNKVVQTAIDMLVDQTRSIERVVAALGIRDVTIEGSDSLDNPKSVFE